MERDPVERIGPDDECRQKKESWNQKVDPEDPECRGVKKRQSTGIELPEVTTWNLAQKNAFCTLHKASLVRRNPAVAKLDREIAPVAAARRPPFNRLIPAFAVSTLTSGFLARWQSWSSAV